jgi:hypothetical protein
MAKDTRTRAQKNRDIRKDAMREQLKNQKLVEKVVEIAGKLKEEYMILEATQIQSLKASADLNIKLINKYLPDLKAVELTGEDGGAIKTDNTLTVTFVGGLDDGDSASEED